MMQFTLHDLPSAERPRERLVEHGIKALSTPEVLALVLGRGVSGEPVMQVVAHLLQRFGSLKGISEASLQDLQQVKGVGLAKACQLQACVEVARRMQTMESVIMPKIIDPANVWKTVMDRLANYHKEHYVLLSLDARSRLLGVDVLSIGTLDAALVHPRETFEVAIHRHAAKVIVCHNHPSGDSNPSDDDLAITKRLATAGKILGITVVDHVIITKQDFYSLHEHGQI